MATSGRGRGRDGGPHGGGAAAAASAAASSSPVRPAAAAAAAAADAAADSVVPLVHPLLAHKLPPTGPGGVALGEHHGGDFGIYYEHKKAKLAQQYAAAYGAGGSDAAPAAPAAAADPSAAAIFRGVRVWINGYTDPPVDELKLLVGRGGGVVDHYLSSAVTHIVATNLPDSKIKQIRDTKRWMPVVYPSWIVNSAAAGRQLDASAFLLPAFRETPRASLSAAFAAAAPPPPLVPPPPLPVAPPPPPPPVPPLPPAPPTSRAVQLPLAAIVPAPPPPLPPAGDDRRNRNAGNDPSFMEGYFAASRLHFIGSFRAAVQNIVAAGQHAPAAPPLPPPPPPAAADAVAPSAPPSEDAAGTAASAPPPSLGGAPGDTSGWPRVIAHVDVDCFFAQVALLDKPHLRDTPVVVAHGGRPGGAVPRSKQFGDGVDTGAVGDAAPRRAPVVGGMAIASYHTAAPVGTAPAGTAPAAAVAAHPAPAGSGGGRGGEVSSANYPARAFGIHAGMNVAAAVALCPHLTVLPYDFERITSVSEAIFRHFLGVTPVVEALSCDEAYLDVTAVPAPLERIARLRADIFAATRCTVSAGVGPNMLLARLATGRAKPDGMYVVPPDAAAVTAFLLPLDASVLPGVGWASRAKLEARGVRTVAQLREVPRGELESLFGPTLGARLWAAARGADDRVVRPTRARKSVGAEVNWGVRFADGAQARDFIRKLCGEVASRLAAAGREVAVALTPPLVPDAPAAATLPPPPPPPPVKGRCITLSVMVRQPGAGAPWKFMGHGACDTHTRTATLAAPTASAATLTDAVLHLYAGLGVDPTQVRGVGVHVSKLEMPGGSGGGGGGGGGGDGPARGSAGLLARFLHRGGVAGGVGGSSRAPPTAGGDGGDESSEADTEAADSACSTDSDGLVMVVGASKPAPPLAASGVKRYRPRTIAEALRGDAASDSGGDGEGGDRKRVRWQAAGGGGGAVATSPPRRAASPASIVVVDDDDDDDGNIAAGPAVRHDDGESEVVCLLSQPASPLAPAPAEGGSGAAVGEVAAHVTEGDMEAARVALLRVVPAGDVTRALRRWLLACGAYPSGAQSRRLAAYACALVRDDAAACTLFLRTLRRHAADIRDEAAVAAAALAAGAVTLADLPPALVAAWAAPPAEAGSTCATWADAAAFVCDEAQRAFRAVRGGAAACLDLEG